MTVRTFGPEMVAELSTLASESPRKRIHRNLHASYGENCQRLFNAIGVDSYIPPHRHSADPKVETLIAVQGLMTLVIFDPEGEVIEAIKFGAGDHARCAQFGVEISSGTWHTVIADLPLSVLFEVKAGPFDPGSAKEFAPWAPAEGSKAAGDYLQSLRAKCMKLVEGRTG